MNENNRHNILLTGTPRGGTTLSCHLLNKLPDTVALHEPLQWQALSAGADHAVVCREIDTFIQETRGSLLQTGSAVSQQQNGRVPDNPVGDYPLGAAWIPRRLLAVPLLRRFGLRSSRVSRAKISIAKSLGPDFTLCIKHTGPFTALLAELLETYRVHAIVRNPLAVLLSWNSIDFHLRDGHHPQAELLDPALASRLARITDRFERQTALLAWFFAQYETLLPAEQIIRYEDIIASGGRALSTIIPEASQLHEPLASRNRSPLYDERLRDSLAEGLLKSSGPFWAFYSRDSVLALCEKSGL